MLNGCASEENMPKKESEAEAGDAEDVSRMIREIRQELGYAETYDDHKVISEAEKDLEVSHQEERDTTLQRVRRIHKLAGL